jgi:hypothetical protein
MSKEIMELLIENVKRELIEVNVELDSDPIKYPKKITTFQPAAIHGYYLNKKVLLGNMLTELTGMEYTRDRLGL